MDQPQPQSYGQPQFVMMPVQERNGLGVFGFFMSLIGLAIPTGLLSILGLVLSLAAIGRSPRGFATTGVILGLLGTIFWIAVMFLLVAVGLVAALGVAVAAAGAIVLTQSEAVHVTADMINAAIAVEDYEREHGEIPADFAALGLGVAGSIDPWGGQYKLVLVDEKPGFDVVSSGLDREFDTDDDVRLSTLDRMWEAAMENFDQDMEEFGERMERFNGFQYSYSDGCLSTRVCGAAAASAATASAATAPAARSASAYESAAAEAIAVENEDAVEVPVADEGDADDQ